MFISSLGFLIGGVVFQNEQNPNSYQLNPPAMDFSPIPSVTGIVILDTNGSRLFSKYYDLNFRPQLDERLSFESSMFKKSYDSGKTDIMSFEDAIVVYSFIRDVYFYVIGPVQENELILTNVLDTLTTSLTTLLK